MTKVDFSKYLSRKIQIVALAAWFLYSQFIESWQFTVIAIAYIITEGVADAFHGRKAAEDSP